MSASFFKKAINASDLRVTMGSGGDRRVRDSEMDLDRPRRGNGPGMIRGRGRGKGRDNYNSHSQHDNRDRERVPLTQRLGERMRGRGRGRGGRGRGRGGHHYSDNANINRDEKRWFQVTIPFGKKSEKEELLNPINELLDMPFCPTGFHYEGQAASFYVEMTSNEIDALKSISKRVTLPNGFKLTILARPGEPPVPKAIEGAMLEKLMLSMSNHYNDTTKVLDLSSFHKVEDMKPDVLPLNRLPVIEAVVQVISSQIPELVELNLSGNRLNTMAIERLSKLIPKTKNLIALDLSENPELRSSDLEKLTDWGLTKINLSNTSFARQFNDRGTYLSAVRKRFPNIIKLDGEEAPAPIGFLLDDSDDKVLPPIRSNYFGPEPVIQGLLQRFLAEYYKLWDSSNRLSLMPAYHENAVFSFGWWFYPCVERQPRFECSQDSRNLLKMTNDTGRINRLKKGRADVLKLLTTLPVTKTLEESLTVDLVHQSEAVLVFTIVGLHEEVNASKAMPTTRMFNRTFTCIPQGEGQLAIISEMLCLAACPKEKRKAILATAKSRSTAPAPVATAGPSTSATAVVASPSAEAHQAQLCQRFMADSGMNQEWSLECLKANNWDYAAAGQMFLGLKTEGKIPPEAYTVQPSS